MPALARGQASDCANPVLDVWTAVNGILTDVYQLQFQIWEKVTDPMVPVQVFPVTPGNKESVDVSQDCPAGGKISTGRYVATYTPDLAEPIGEHEIRWFFKLTASSPEQTFKQEFEVLAEVTGSSGVGYCSIADIRDEGVTTEIISDARLQKVIQRSSKLVDRYTGRFFSPRSLTFSEDGDNNPTVFLGQPIIAISSVALEGNVLLVGDFKVYNRHITQNLEDPDDRDDPRIELEQPREGTLLFRDTHGRRLWPRGQQNIQIAGVFGYTEYDGSPQGQTPELICEATKGIVLREMWQKFGQRNQYEDAVSGSTVTELKTRDQTIKYRAGTLANAGRQGVGPFTGDPQIDNILLMFRRPFGMRAV